MSDEFSFLESGSVSGVEIGLPLIGIVSRDDSDAIQSVRLLTSDEPEHWSDYLSNVPSIELMEIEHNTDADEWLTEFQGLHSLVRLFVDDTNATDSGIERIASNPNLQWLDLDNTNISDDGMGYLLSLQNLTHLFISGTQITDVGLETLLGLPRLQFLSLCETSISENAIREFRAQKPACNIFM